MKNNKMTKNLMKIFLNNLDLVPIQEYLSYKNMDEINLLLIKLAYNKII